MTPEAQRIAIAEACGWTKVHWYEDNAGPNILSGIPYLTEEEIFRTDERQLYDLRTYGKTVPNYLCDLNAMHEAEKILKGSKDDEHSDLAHYQENLCLVCGDGMEPINVYEIDMIRATAAQRAEAFLRCMGKWVE